ncbi:MAG: S-methyl-5-thioribose-1-phosphate isomerase [Bacteroidota bacterium]|nr:S-methyl-5-thioribose-1-phosphate isomerase [Bacteroidota bacterium]
MTRSNDTIEVLNYSAGTLTYLDQTCLPSEVRYRVARTPDELVDALRRLAIRGAPLIGVAAAYGIASAARNASRMDLHAFRVYMLEVCDRIGGARPTAVNLGWAVGICRELVLRCSDPSACASALEETARRIHEDDARRCAAIGEQGAELIPPSAGIITYCNTGALATGGEGTALGVILAAHRRGKRIHVFVCETRPHLQGSRLTMWELTRRGIPATLITDGTAAVVMREGRADLVITGADRIAQNGDTANKIGTYALAVAAHHHGIPFYIAAPVSSIDFQATSGGEIPIEIRPASDITEFGGVRIAPEGVDAFAPAFDTTPAALIHAVITERGIIRPPYDETLRGLRS